MQVSLRPARPTSSGTLLTQPLQLPTCAGSGKQLSLELNLETTLTGTAIVEVIPEAGAHASQLTGAGAKALRSILLVGDSAHHPVQFGNFSNTSGWAANPALPSSMCGAVVRISFELTGNADLYGFQFLCTPRVS